VNASLRTPTDDDWPGILRVAHEAAPWAGEANEIWLANRRGFDRARIGGSHYVAEEGDRVVGYGAIEGDRTGGWRVFVVMAPDRLGDGTGDLVLDRLTADLRERQARVVWMREEARDEALKAFAAQRGFVETQRVEVEGIEIVLLERTLTDSKDQDREGLNPSGNSAP
jgi:N-acetylglutamate synthase-like GNAT family acetyltransferase